MLPEFKTRPFFFSSAFESELRSSSGLSDPLDPWSRYVAWVEQNFPRGGREGGLNVLLEKCIKEFKDDDRFKQDPRYLAVWTKYVSVPAAPPNKRALHNLSSVGTYYTVHMGFAHLVPNCTLSRHLFTIIINIVLCYVCTPLRPFWHQIVCSGGTYVLAKLAYSSLFGAHLEIY